MSWFWRSKYDQEKRRSENSSSVLYLQKQLERIGALYNKEKQVANKWRRFKKTRFPLKKNESSGIDSSKGKLYTAKASLASKYWVQAILSIRAIDFDGFKKRWTKDLEKLRNESCISNKSIVLKEKRNRFARNKNKEIYKKANDLGQGNVTDKKSMKSLKTDKRIKNILHERVFGPTVRSPVGYPIGPTKMRKRQLMFGPINIERKSKKGETVRRRRDKIRDERLKKREARRKALEIKHQVKELKYVIAELRKERRKAEKEKFQLETSWRKLKRQREMFEQEKKQQHKSEKKKLTQVKSKLNKTKTRLMTWKNVATKFKKKAANLQRDMKKISGAKKTAKNIKNIKRDLKLEKRKLRKQRQDLKTLKNKLRQEHRNYAREGWKLMQKQKKLEKLQSPTNQSKTSAKCRKKSKQGKTPRIRLYRKKKSKAKAPRNKRSNKNKKSRWKQHKQTFIKYWENLEKTLKEWTQNLNKTVKQKSEGKIKKVWKKLQEKFGNLINLNWAKQKKAKPPFHAKKKHKKRKESKSKASAIYEKVLAEQREFDRQKRKLDKSTKQMKLRGPTIIPEKKIKRKKNLKAVVKQRRRKQRRKYQRELERLQQWALQMNEKKIEHERIFKDKEKRITGCTKMHLKSKPTDKDIQDSGGGSNSISDVDADSIDESSNLTNTLMLLVEHQFNDYQYERFTKFDPGQKEPLENTESIMHDITMAQLKHERKKQKSTDLSIPWDDGNVILPSSQTPLQKSDPAKDRRNSPTPTPPVLGPSMYNKFPMFGILDSYKGGSIGLPIPPPTLDPLKPRTTAKQNIQSDKSLFRDKTPETWAPPPSPLQSAVPTVQRPKKGLLAKVKAKKQNPSKQDSTGSDVTENGNWMFLRASGRAHQRILYEPLNKQSAKDRSKRQTKKTYFHRRRRKAKDKDGSWVFERASDREEQRVNKDPWYMRRAEGREDDRGEDQSSWFIERGFDRELLRKEDETDAYNHGNDDEYDDDYDDDDDFYYDIDFGHDGYDDISAA